MNSDQYGQWMLASAEELGWPRIFIDAQRKRERRWAVGELAWREAVANGDPLDIKVSLSDWEQRQKHLVMKL